MNRVNLEILRDFGQGLGFNDLLPFGEDHAIHLTCENGHIIGFQVVEEVLLCFVRIEYEPVELDVLWAKLFALVDAEDWKARQWHVGLRGVGGLEIFIFLPESLLSTEMLHQLFSEMWELRDIISRL